MIDKKKMTRRIILAIIVFAVLILTVTFSTYAFFNYYRTGAKNQRLTTGRIKMEFTEGTNNINLTNQFPISDASAVGMTSSGDEVVVTEFTVSGYAGGNTTLKYQVSALAGSAVSNRVRMPDNHIKIYMTVDTHDIGKATIAPGFNTASEGVYGALASGNIEDLGDGEQWLDTGDGGEIALAQGEVAVDDTTHNYSMRMWISDMVTISDTDTSKTYCASTDGCVDSRNIFSNMYYSLRLRVDNLDVNQ